MTRRLADITSPRLRRVATATVLAVPALILAGCGGSSAGDVYQASEDAWSYVIVDGDSVLYLAPTRDTLLQAVDDLDSGSVEPDAAYVEDTGTINEAGDTVIWSDGDDAPIEVAEDMVRLDDEVYISYDSEQATSSREETVADWHEYND